MSWIDDLNSMQDVGSVYRYQRPTKQPRQEKPKGAGRAGGLKGLALDILPFGRVVEKSVNPNAGQVTGGELLSEALLTAVPFGLGKIAKGAKGAKGLKGALASADTVPTKPVRRRLADELTARGGGFKVGGQVGGTSRIDEATDVFQRYGVTGTPKQQLKKIDRVVMPSLGKSVDEILAKSSMPLSGKSVRASVQQAVNDPLKYAELDLSLPGVRKHLDSHLLKFERAGSAKEVNDYIKTLNPTAIRAQDKLARGVALTDKESAALAAKKAGDEVLSEIPEIAPLKKDMATLFNRYAETSAQVGKKSGIPVVGGVLSAPASLARALESKAGQVLSGQGSGTVGAAKGLPATLASALAAQGGVRIGADTLGMRDKGILPEVAAPVDTNAMQMYDPMMDTATGQSEALPMDASPYPRENLLMDIQRDPVNAEQYMAYYQQLQEMFTPVAPELAADQRKTVAATTNAENVINEIEQAYNSIGGAQGALEGTVRNLAGKVRLDQDARYYNDLRQAFLSRIARAFGEVGTLAEGDIQRAINSIPDIADTPDNAARKFATLRGLLAQAKANAVGGVYGTYGEEPTLPASY